MQCGKRRRKMGFNIAIDGPAGAGKSTIAKLAAKELSFIYVDTGAMYRTIGLYMTRIGVDLNDREAVAAHVQEAQVSISYQDGEQQVLLNGENVSSLIRGEAVGAMASAVSRHPEVRGHLLDLQRKLARECDVLMDGRDIGTCILPNADLKIFLTAAPEVRAQRRYLEQKSKGENCTFEDVLKKVIDRDYQDSHREVAPLKRADDAMLVDTSKLTIQESADTIVRLAKERMAAKE